MIKKKRVWIPSLIVILMAITYFSGPVPPDPDYSNSWSEVPQNLDKLEKFIAEHEDSLPVREDNHARILWNDSIKKVTEYSFVYLHGFAGSYRDGYPLNVEVAEAFGSNIYLSRWAGHGLKPPHSLEGFEPETAWETAKEALAIGHQIGKKVIIISTSTGGTLAMKLAAEHPDSVHALINISPNVREGELGAFLLNSPWGNEIAHLVSFGEKRRVRHEEEAARQYWDTLYRAEALIDLQALVETTMKEETFEKVECPVLTLYYYKNFLQEDKRVEIDDYPTVHDQFATPDSLLDLKAIESAGSHYIGSEIKSDDYETALREIIRFCRDKLNMKLSDASEDITP